VDDKGTRWLLETKGAETRDVAHKDIAAAQWCANAAQLTGTKWQYLKVPQKGFETLQPSRLEHLTGTPSIRATELHRCILAIFLLQVVSASAFSRYRRVRGGALIR